METILYIIVLIGVIAAVGRAVSKARDKRRLTGEASVSKATTTDLSDFYGLIEQMEKSYLATAQPQDLLSSKPFEAAVNLLFSKPLRNQAILEYAAGGNPLISCIAYEVLRRKGLDEHEIDSLISTLANRAPFAMHFAFRAIHRWAETPVLGKVLSQIQPWWLENEYVIRVLRPFISDRIDAEERLTFGDRLSGLDINQAKGLQSLFRRLNLDRLRPLSEELSCHIANLIDYQFLNSFGRMWVPDEISDPILEHPQLRVHLEKIKDILFNTPRRSVVLLGEPGVGKTTLIKRLASEIQQDQWQLFEANASDVLAGQIFIGQLEERLQMLTKNLQAQKRILWLVPNFHELYYAGRSQYNPTGVLDRLVPEIERGEILLIGETTPAAFERLSQQNKRFGMMMEKIRMLPLDDQQTLEIAQHWSGDQDLCEDGSLIISEQIAKEALHLSKQFLTDQAAPGNLLDLLKLTVRSTLSAKTSPRQMTMDDLYLALSHLTGLPRSILDERVGLDLKALKEFFQQRVLGQPEAVDCLVERVALIKTGLTDSSRPFGVFLFAGPTGTGKTEIAKTLAEFLFGSPDRMIRLDMSEYQTPESLESILGERRSDLQATEMASSLFMQVRKQPFSVILLDEFEKAHFLIWDLFLQVFDDGRLTDRSGNTANFRNCIIILTSNLGSKLQAGESIGFSPSSQTFSQAGVEKAIHETFRREFINRLDRVVIFRPLSRRVMREILHNELKKVLTRRGLRMREWAVEWEDTALDFLLDKGFTSDLGARPLKRAVERYLLSPLALTISDHRIPEGDQFLFVRSDGQKIEVEFIDPDAPEEATERVKEEIYETSEPELGLKRILLGAKGTGPELQILKTHHAGLAGNIHGETWALRKATNLSKTNNTAFWQSEERFSVLGEVEYMDRIESGLKTADSLLSRLAGDGRKTKDKYSIELVTRLAEQLYLLETAHEALIRGLPKDAFLRIETHGAAATPNETGQIIFRNVCRMYQQWAAKRRMRLQVLEEVFNADSRPHLFLASVTGFGSFSILNSENGLHLFEVPKEDNKNFHRHSVRVSVVPQPNVPAQGQTALLEQARRCFSEFRPSETKVVRRYRDKPSPLVRDQDGNWRTGRIDRVLNGDFDLFD
ncbi:MAG TPA: AAA family ATPase [Thermodesulfobacteriota bacterium]|nr:AAA family ATPase [Thermodesulfobacteriota bacterium]